MSQITVFSFSFSLRYSHFVFHVLIKTQVEQGSKTELPFWLARELHMRQAVSISVPACFNLK
jgi:hypothetical protein